MLELTDKDFKAATIKMLQWITAKHSWSKWKNRKSSKEIEDTKNNQMEILELKNVIIKI